MRTVLLTLTTTTLLLSPGCGNDDRRGLPPAAEWHQPTEPGGGGGGGGGMGSASGEMPDDDVHAGAGGGGGELGPATGEMPDDDVHAGAGGAGGGMPSGHGGAATSDQPIDPSKFLEGTVVAGPAAQKAIKPGMVLYLSTKPVGTADCVVKGIIPSASKKVIEPKLPFGFKMTEEDARMMGGGTLDGEYLLCAHLSTTGDASNKVTGDVFGSAKVKVPQKGITITLDTVLP